MAYPIPSGAIIEVVMDGRQDGQQVMNVWHFYMQKEGGIDDGRNAAINLLATLNGGGGWFPNYLNCLTNQVENIKVSAQWITPIRYAKVFDPAIAAEGAVLLDGLPCNTQVALTLKGDIADRHHLGRKAMPGVPFDWVTNSEVNDANLATYQTFCDSMVFHGLGVEGETYDHVIFNRTTPELSPIVTAAFPQKTVRVDRRRTVRVGS